MDRDGASETEQGRKTVMPITPRAVLLGVMAVAFLAIVNPYLAFVSRTWSVGSGGLLGSTLVVLFGLVLFNGLLLRLAPRLAFSRGELLVVYGMLIISVGLIMQGGLPYIVASTVYPFHMATPENGWEHMILPHIPLWLRPHRLEVVEWFWQGSPSGFGVPWGDWLTPMLAWGGFTLALMGSMFCLGALLSKDWIETSARNQFRGPITGVNERDGIVMIDIDVGEVFTVQITRRSFNEMGLKLGEPVNISFKASSVLPL